MFLEITLEKQKLGDLIIMNLNRLKESNNLVSILTVSLLVLLAIIGVMDDFGAGVLNYTVSLLVHQFIDYIVLMFAVGLLLALFAARGWIRRLLTSV